MPIFFSQLPAAWAAVVPRPAIPLVAALHFLCGAWFAPSPTHTHIAHKSPLSLPPSPYWLQCQSPAGPSAALPLRLCQDQGTTQHSTTKHSHNQGNHQPASPSGRNQARGLLYASQQQKAGSQNPKTTTKQERHNLHADPSAVLLLLPFLPPHVLLALGTSDFVCVRMPLPSC